MKFTKKYGENTFITYENHELYTCKWDLIKYPFYGIILTILIFSGLYLFSWICGFFV